MPQVAFMTIGILKEPYGSPVVQGFWDRAPDVFEQAEACVGFIDRSRRNMETFQHSWGELCIPSIFAEIGDLKRLPMTLSLWEDLESVAAFSYRGFHGEAMVIRREWFLENEFPGYVAWWVEEGHQPTFEEGAKRMEHLHRQGPTPEAFNFKQAFDAEGLAYQLVSAKVKERVTANQPRTKVVADLVN